ncbi:MAG: hypothetical protein ACTTJY_11385 [Hoylesella shahii]
MLLAAFFSLRYFILHRFFGAKWAFSTILPFYLVKEAPIFTALKTAFSSQKAVF